MNCLSCTKFLLTSAKLGTVRTTRQIDRRSEHNINKHWKFCTTRTLGHDVGRHIKLNLAYTTVPLGDGGWIAGALVVLQFLAVIYFCCIHGVSKHLNTKLREESRASSIANL